MKKTLPKTVTIAGNKFKMIWDHEFDDAGDYGDTDTLGKLIRIGTKCDTPGKKAETSFHEFLHASLGVSGVSEMLGDKLEEAVVLCIEHAVFPHLDLLIEIRDGKRK